MSNGIQRLTRAERVAAIGFRPGVLAQTFETLRRGDVLLRLALCFAAAIAMWALTCGWAPPFAYRTGYVPPRDIVARTEFSVFSPDKTEDAKRKEKRDVICFYQNDPKSLVDLRQALKDRVFAVLSAASFDKLDKQVWLEFLPRNEEPGETVSPLQFEQFRAALAHDAELGEFEAAVQRAFSLFEEDGLLERLQHTDDEGNQTTIFVHPLAGDSTKRTVDVDKIRITEALRVLRPRLLDACRVTKIPEEHWELVSQLCSQWIKNRGLPGTLSLSVEATSRAREKAIANVVANENYAPGAVLAKGGRPLSEQNWQTLKIEHESFVQRMGVGQKISYSAADFGMYLALYVLSGAYIFVHQPRLVADLPRFATLLALVVVTVSGSSLSAWDSWRAEITPMVMFGMIVTIAYQRELALVLTAVVSIIVIVSLGYGLPEFVVMVAGVSAAVLMLGRIRSRTRLIYVGLGAAAVSALTTIGVGTLAGQAFGASSQVAVPDTVQQVAGGGFLATVGLMRAAAWSGFCTVIAGFLMSGMLPFVERVFNVQTDLSLLELGDAAHPLLQQLAQRAPGTYNHSINVGSIGEKAAESIGANGLLVRVGAYFHDIGKILKPSYFIENQGQNDNRHDSLVPAMSTLVIIAHVKDGADLARQHHLPQSIIDFIEQHHGTTLVEYFFRRAEERSEDDPDAAEVDETSFRYPGPKPQTREAAVMMVADAVESSSRTLADPAPARIESLVHELVMKRLLDGQFDECGLTLVELRAIEDSLVKSLTSMFHSRIKYPSQPQSA